MTSLPVFVGVDYADSVVQVCVMDRSGKVAGNRALNNDAGALDKYVRQFGDQVHASIEACSGASNLADELTNQYGWSVSLAHPGYVRRMKQNPDKTDHADAWVLADLMRLGYLPRVWLAPPAVRDLRHLVRYRMSQVAERRAYKQRVRALLREHRLACPVANPWTRRWWIWIQELPLPANARWVMDRQLAMISHYDREIYCAEKRLAEVAGDDPAVMYLMSQRGIGLVTACVLRAEIGDFGRFRTGKQLARMCGLSPCNRSSGGRQADAGLIKAANPLLRATLIEAGQRLRRFDPRWQAFSQRLRQAGKPTNVIVVAVANRWVRWLFHQLQMPKDTRVA